MRRTRESRASTPQTIGPTRHGSKQSGRRPQRFCLCLPVWYRAASETEWHTGLTRSVSSTGALIRADESGVPAKRVIVAIALPSADGCLVGRGRVVRKIEAAAEGAPASFAVAVSHYRLERRDSVLRRAV
jgi:hypothetical protein